jgi:hypothetical protein
MARGAKDRGREGGGGLGMRYKKGLTSAAVITAATVTASVYAAAHRATLRAPCWGRSVGVQHVHMAYSLP